MSLKSEKAVAAFTSGFNCSQSTLSVFCDELSLDRESAFKIACGFGAGMGRKGEICDALSGAIIALGARYGRGENDDPAATAITYRRTSELLQRFTEKHGSVRCKELLDGCDFTTPQGQQLFAEKEMKRNICVPCVETAVTLVEELLSTPV